MTIEQQLVLIKHKERVISDALTNELFEHFEEMKLSGTIPFTGFLSRNGFGPDSVEKKLFHSDYQNEILRQTEKNLYWRGYRVKINVDSRAIVYHSQLIDVRWYKHVVFTLLTTILSVILYTVGNTVASRKNYY